MKERPILMSAPMVRAILDGRKTMTRRFCETYGESLHYGKKLCEWHLSSGPYLLTGDDLPVWRWRGRKEPKVGDWAQSLQTDVDDNINVPIRNPYGQPGDRLWVRETLRPSQSGIVTYAENGCPAWRSGESVTWPWIMTPKVRTSIFMPRWASRITLEITGVRVERVQEISERDAAAEGTQEPSLRELGGALKHAAWSERQVFQRLWDSINGLTHPWANNDWVWVIEFRRVS